jgi:hypothetical protein
MTVNKNDRFKHIKTGNVYIVISTTKMKIGEWIPGVIYTREDVDYGELYTRELKDFETKFEKIYDIEKRFLSL